MDFKQLLGGILQGADTGLNGGKPSPWMNMAIGRRRPSAPPPIQLTPSQQAIHDMADGAMEGIHHRLTPPMTPTLAPMGGAGGYTSGGYSGGYYGIDRGNGGLAGGGGNYGGGAGMSGIYGGGGDPRMDKMQLDVLGGSSLMNPPNSILMPRSNAFAGGVYDANSSDPQIISVGEGEDGKADTQETVVLADGKAAVIPAKADKVGALLQQINQKQPESVATTPTPPTTNIVNRPVPDGLVQTMDTPTKDDTVNQMLNNGTIDQLSRIGQATKAGVNYSQTPWGQMDALQSKLPPPMSLGTSNDLVDGQPSLGQSSGRAAPEGDVSGIAGGYVGSDEPPPPNRNAWTLQGGESALMNQRQKIQDYLNKMNLKPSPWKDLGAALIQAGDNYFNKKNEPIQSWNSIKMKRELTPMLQREAQLDAPITDEETKMMNEARRGQIEAETKNIPLRTQAEIDRWNGMMNNNQKRTGILLSNVQRKQLDDFRKTYPTFKAAEATDAQKAQLEQMGLSPDFVGDYDVSKTAAPKRYGDVILKQDPTTKQWVDSGIDPKKNDPITTIKLKDTDGKPVEVQVRSSQKANVLSGLIKEGMSIDAANNRQQVGIAAHSISIAQNILSNISAANGINPATKAPYTDEDRQMARDNYLKDLQRDNPTVYKAIVKKAKMSVIPEDVAQTYLSGGTIPPPEKVRGGEGWWTSDRVNQAVNHLQANAGLSPMGAKGLVARWAGVESRGGPNSVNPNSGATGIGQWLGSRKIGVPSDFTGQLNHVVKELNTTESAAARRLRNAQTPEDAATGASMYERAEGYNPKTGRDNFTGQTIHTIHRLGVPDSAPVDADTIAQNYLNSSVDVNTVANSYLGQQKTEQPQNDAIDPQAIAQNYLNPQIVTPNTQQFPQADIVPTTTDAVAEARLSPDAMQNEPQQASQRPLNEMLSPDALAQIQGGSGVLAATKRPMARPALNVASPQPANPVIPPDAVSGAIPGAPLTSEPVISDENLTPTADEQKQNDAIMNAPKLQQVTLGKKNVDWETGQEFDPRTVNAVSDRIDIPDSVKTADEAEKYVKSQLEAKYGQSFANQKFLANWKPGHGADVTYGALMDAGVDINPLIQQKVAENRIENPNLKLDTGHDWTQEDANILRDAVNTVTAPLGGAVGTALNLNPIALSALFGDTAASTIATALNSGGNTSKAVAGALRIIADMNPASGDSMAEAAGLKPYRPGEDIVKYLKDVAETASQLADKSSGKYRDTATADDKGYLEGRPIERTTLGTKVGQAVGGLADLPRIALMPGGMAAPFLSFATDAMLQQAAEGDQVDYSKLAPVGAKNAAIGALTMVAPGVGKAADTVLGTLLNQASSNLIKEGVTLGTIGTGTFLTAKASGDTNDEAFNQAVMMSAYHAVGKAQELGHDITNTPIRVKDVNGNEAVINIDKNGKVTTLDPKTEAQAQIVIPKTPTESNRAAVRKGIPVPDEVVKGEKVGKDKIEPESNPVEQPKVESQVGAKVDQSEPWQLSQQNYLQRETEQEYQDSKDALVKIKSGETPIPKGWDKDAQIASMEKRLAKRDTLIDVDSFKNEHKRSVDEALAKGKDVPADVLKDYPDLVKKYEQSPSPDLVGAGVDRSGGQLNPHGDNELEMVANGTKPVALFGTEELSRKGRADFIQKNNLKTAEFHNKLSGFDQTVIAKTQADADSAAKQLEELHSVSPVDHSAVGRILGYSEADTKAFADANPMPDGKAPFVRPQPSGEGNDVLNDLEAKSKERGVYLAQRKAERDALGRLTDTSQGVLGGAKYESPKIEIQVHANGTSEAPFRVLGSLPNDAYGGRRVVDESLTKAFPTRVEALNYANELADKYDAQPPGAVDTQTESGQPQRVSPTEPNEGEMGAKVDETAKSIKARLDNGESVDYSPEALKHAFNLTDDEANATHAIVKGMGLDTSKISVAKNGKAGEGALEQGEVKKAFITALLAHNIMSHTSDVSRYAVDLTNHKATHITQEMAEQNKNALRKFTLKGKPDLDSISEDGFFDDLDNRAKGIVEPGTSRIQYLPDPVNGHYPKLSFSVLRNRKGMVLIPRNVGGELLTPKEAVQEYKDSHIHYGVFDSTKNALDYANSVNRALDVASTSLDKIGKASSDIYLDSKTRDTVDNPIWSDKEQAAFVQSKDSPNHFFVNEPLSRILGQGENGQQQDAAQLSAALDSALGKSGDVKQLQKQYDELTKKDDFSDSGVEELDQVKQDLEAARNKPTLEALAKIVKDEARPDTPTSWSVVRPMDDARDIENVGRHERDHAALRAMVNDIHPKKNLIETATPIFATPEGELFLKDLQGRVGYDTNNAESNLFELLAYSSPKDLEGMSPTDVAGRLNLYKKGIDVVRQVYGDEAANLVADHADPTFQELVNKSPQPLFQGAKGTAEIADNGRAIIRGMKSADVSTGVHEIAHVARRQLLNRDIAPEQRAGITDDDITTAEKWAGASKGWNVPAEEKFARGFERYLRDGKAPTPELQTVFAKFKDWLTGIYKTLKGSDINVKISPEMRDVFDRLVTRNSAESRALAIDSGDTVIAPKDTLATAEELVNQHNEEQQSAENDKIVNAKGEINYDAAKDVAGRIESGEATIKRLDPAGEQGRIAGGRRAIEASLILARSERASEESGSRTHPVKRQERALEEYAKHEGIWFDPGELRQNFVGKGNEATVHSVDDGKSVQKVIDYKQIDKNATPLDFIDNRIATFNHLFPETAYELVGFTRTKDGFRFVIKQPLIRDAVYTTPVERQAFMKNKGFEMVDKYGEEFANEFYHVSDLHEKNALKMPDGSIVVIDAVTKAKPVGDFEVITNEKSSSQSTNIDNAPAPQGKGTSSRTSDTADEPTSKQNSATTSGSTNGTEAGRGEASGNVDATSKTFDTAGDGGNSSGEQKVEESKTTGTKNAVTEAEREDRNEPPLMKAAAQDHPTVMKLAKERLAENPQAGEDLVQSLAKTSRPIDSVEEAVLMHEKVNRVLALDKANEDVANAKNEGEYIGAQHRLRVALERADEIDRVNQAAGREWGRSGRFRQELMKHDYSLATLQREEQARLPYGQKLTQEHLDKIQEQHDRIKALEGHLREYENDQTDAQNQSYIDQIVKQLDLDRKTAKKSGKPLNFFEQQEQNAINRVQKRGEQKIFNVGGNPAELAQMIADHAIIGAAHIARGVKKGVDFTEAMVKKLGEKFRPELEKYANDIYKASEKFYNANLKALKTKSAAEILKDAKPGEIEPKALMGGLVKAHLREGASPTDALDSAVKDAKTIYPDASERSLRDAFSDYGTQTVPTHDELLRQMGEAKRLATLASSIEDAQSGKRPFKLEHGQQTQSEAIQAKEAELDAAMEAAGIKPERTPMSDKTKQAIRVAGLEKRIEQVKKQIATGEKPVKGNPVTSPRIEALKKELASLNEQLPKVKRELTEAQRLANKKGALNRSLKDIKEKIATRNFTPKTRKPLTLDKEATKILAEVTEAKRQAKGVHRSVERQQRYDASAKVLGVNAEKFKDRFTWWVREAALSSPGAVSKLTSAALETTGITSVEEFAGHGWGKLFKRIAQKADVESTSGLKLSEMGWHEARAISQGFIRMIDDIPMKAKTGQLDFEKAFGDVKMEDEMVDYMSRMHGALKTIPMRTAFTRTSLRLNAKYLSQGIDISDPLIQMQIGNKAYNKALEAVFLNKNWLSKLMDKANASLAKPNADTGKIPLVKTIVSGILKSELPIVRVPVNLVFRGGRAIGGVPLGLTKVLKAHVIDGVDNLTTEQADLIFKQLKQGTPGAAMALLGFFAGKGMIPGVQAGGLYTDGDKKKKGDVPYGAVRIKPLYDATGVDIPAIVMHIPIFMAWNWGATVARVADAYEKKNPKTSELWAYSDAMRAATWGMIKEIPYIDAYESFTGLLSSDRGATKFIGESLSKLNPQAIQWLARKMDREGFSVANGTLGSEVKRKPVSIMDYVKQGIPFMRQQVRNADPLIDDAMVSPAAREAQKKAADVSKLMDIMEQMKKQGQDTSKEESELKGKLNNEDYKNTLTKDDAERANALLGTDEYKSDKEVEDDPPNLRHNKDAKTFLEKAATWLQALSTSPSTAWDAVDKWMKGESIRRMENDAIIVKRMDDKGDGSSGDVRSRRGGGGEEVKLDHTVPLELGGDNSEENLRLVTTDEWAKYSPIENYLGSALHDNTITAAQAKEMIVAFKNGTMTKEQVIQKTGMPFTKEFETTPFKLKIPGRIPVADNVKQELEKLQIQIPNTSNSITLTKGVKTQLNTDQYDKLRKEMIERVNKAVGDTIQTPEYKNSTPDQQKIIVNKAIRDARKDERDQVKVQMGGDAPKSRNPFSTRMPGLKLPKMPHF